MGYWIVIAHSKVEYGGIVYVTKFRYSVIKFSQLLCILEEIR